MTTNLDQALRIPGSDALQQADHIISGIDRFDRSDRRSIAIALLRRHGYDSATATACVAAAEDFERTAANWGAPASVAFRLVVDER